MSESKYSVTLGQIIKEFDLEVLCAAPNYEEVPMHTVDVNRPGLPLSGFFEHFDTKRLPRVSGGRPGPRADGAAHQGPDLRLYECPHRQPL